MGQRVQECRGGSNLKVGGLTALHPLGFRMQTEEKWSLPCNHARNHVWPPWHAPVSRHTKEGYGNFRGLTSPLGWTQRHWDKVGNRVRQIHLANLRRLHSQSCASAGLAPGSEGLLKFCSLSISPASPGPCPSLREEQDLNWAWVKVEANEWGQGSTVSLGWAGRRTTLYQLLLFGCIQLFGTPWTAAHQASLSFTFSGSLFGLMSIESMMPSNHLILCCPLLLLPSIFPSIRVFSNELALHIGWPKYWSFSFGISLSDE